MSDIRISIVDDHDFFRRGIKMVINRKERFKVVSESSNGKEFMEVVGKCVPDIVLMDIKMPEMDGIETTKRVMREYPNIKIIALSFFREKDYVMDMIYAGAKGFLFKNSDERVIEDAIRKVHLQGYYFSEHVTDVIT